jgi:hypothetical protein
MTVGAPTRDASLTLPPPPSPQPCPSTAHTRTYLRHGAEPWGDARPRRILSVFSGRPADGFAALVALSGFHVDEIDVVRGGPSHDVTRADVRARILSELRSAAYAAVLVATPCTSFSVARGNHEDGLEHPGLRTFEHESGPPGASETAREFVRKHDAFVDFTIDLANAALNLDLDLAIENPAPRDDPDVASYWPARAHLPQLWDMRRASISGSAPTRHGHEEGSGQTEDAVARRVARGRRWRPRTRAWPRRRARGAEPTRRGRRRQRRARRGDLRPVSEAARARGRGASGHGGGRASV